MQTTRASLADFPVAERMKIAVGDVLRLLLPKTADTVRQNPFAEELSFAEKLIRCSEGYRAVRQGNRAALRERFSSFWQGGHGSAFYDSFAYRFEECFLKDHYQVVEKLRELIEAGAVQEVYELGCGDGKVIDHLAGRFPSVDRFVGIDLNVERIEKNREEYGDRPIEFVSADGIDWLMSNVVESSLLLTYGGVFEYFAREELCDLFSEMKNRSVAICLTEPLGEDYDLEKSRESVSYGVELSFSHNYPELLREQGFVVKFLKEYAMENRWIQIVAIPPSP